MKYLLAAIFTSLLVLATACSQAGPPTKSASDGIQVHGHWTITVTNPDGTLDAVHEFDNELWTYGNDVLTAILAAETSVTGWKVKIDAEPPATINPGIPSWTCAEASTNNNFIAANHTRHLNPTNIADNAGNTFLMVDAVCTVEYRDPGFPSSATHGEIEKIHTYMLIDENKPKLQLDPLGSHYGSYSIPFTKKAFSPTIKVLNSQSIAITVLLSFN